MIDVGKVFLDVHFRVPLKAPNILLTSLHRSEYSSTFATSERVINDRPLQDRADQVHERVMQDALAETGNAVKHFGSRIRENSGGFVSPQSLTTSATPQS